MRNPDQGASKITTAKSSPSDYFEVTFNAYAGVPYQLVILGKADKDYWGNDSVFVQFSGSVSSSGSAKWRIGTTSATEVNLEDCSGCGLSGWKWQDNGYGTGVVAERVYFATTGTQRMRIQTREDGLSIDHIHLIPEAATTRPRHDPTLVVDHQGARLEHAPRHRHRRQVQSGSLHSLHRQQRRQRRVAERSRKERRRATATSTRRRSMRRSSRRRPARPGTTSSHSATATPTARATCC